MRWSWKIGTLAGIGIYIHATFWLLVLFILYANWNQGRSLATTLGGLFFVFLIFGCIVLHELGHALTARKYGIRTRDITLLPIGGLARLERMPDDPRQELWVALAGPAVNLVIAAALYLVMVATGARPHLEQFNLIGGVFLKKLMGGNPWVGGFNLIPAFSIEGGRVPPAPLSTPIDYTQA